jgi:S-formylglutathione hydrolase FrmB
VGRARHGRLLTLMLRSRAMGEVQPVDVLLPARYDSSGRTRYHVLYLLHGAGGDYRSWVQTGIEKLLDRLPVIAVMPSGSTPQMDGNYTDWLQMAPGAAGGAPAWESYHIRELIPFIDAHFPTLAGTAGRAIAGISMGGGGATKYAAEYPGTFGYVGTFSGEADPLLPAALAFQPKTCRWGDPARDQVIWRDNDSADLAANLAGIRVFIRSGTGSPGEFDLPTPPADPIQAAILRVRLIVELGAHLENEALVNALRRAGARGVDARFFPGSHSLAYWQRDTREFLAWLRTQLRHPPRQPSVVTVASAHTWFTAWGWTFQLHRRVREFAYLRLSHDRLRMTGSGTVTVRTPPQFRRRSLHWLQIGRKIIALRADIAGELQFAVDLGPSHAHQQTRFDRAATRGWRTVTTTILR